MALDSLDGKYAFKEGEAYNLFWIGNFNVPIYAFVIVLGMIASIITIGFFWKREGYKLDHFYTLVAITIPTSIIGARLGFIVERLVVGDIASLAHWYNPREGGMSIQGGVFLPTIANLIYAYYKRQDFDWRKAFSFILPAVLIGQALGRWGNFTNHEVYGYIDETGASVNWLGSFIRDNMYITDSVGTGLRVPLFFYEFLTSLFGYIILVWVFNLFSWLKPGATGALYILYYGIVRSSMEYLRQEHYPYYLVLSILMIIIGLLLFVRFQFFADYIFEGKYKLKLVYKPRYRKSIEKNWGIHWIRWNRIKE
ncbi:prolipoprotein diacylglyceryl transferase [Mesomycoplasma bovoculi]|uniref:Phosphatidylglycerol--prolipoprotein diacylglyceryl transferase n=1 Tax=Mesomycoplasma bovoculi M165/69 TaxID=743966 RepID=W5UTP9_9BACT|nr:prolipoprotein diacylglyceryl transferase [Mesomycoplasma bovoculi]AHH45200.1 prolipoprotein diacylglyceryl transferase [Mesomycoplasma bovoculi M165/69]